MLRVSDDLHKPGLFYDSFFEDWHIVNGTHILQQALIKISKFVLNESNYLLRKIGCGVEECVRLCDCVNELSHNAWDARFAFSPWLPALRSLFLTSATRGSLSELKKYSTNLCGRFLSIEALGGCIGPAGWSSQKGKDVNLPFEQKPGDTKKCK